MERISYYTETRKDLTEENLREVLEEIYNSRQQRVINIWFSYIDIMFDELCGIDEASVYMELAKGVYPREDRNINKIIDIVKENFNIN